MLRLALEDCGWGGAVLGRAFAEYPLFRYVIPGKDSRLAKVTWIQKTLMAYGCRYGETYAPPEKNGVVF